MLRIDSNSFLSGPPETAAKKGKDFRTFHPFRIPSIIIYYIRELEDDEVLWYNCNIESLCLWNEIHCIIHSWSSEGSSFDVMLLWSGQEIGLSIIIWFINETVIQDSTIHSSIKWQSKRWYGCFISTCLLTQACGLTQY